MASRSKAWVCGCSLAGIAGSNPAGRVHVCVLSGRGLCVGMITLPEECYRLWCAWMWSWGGRGPGPLGAVAPWKEIESSLWNWKLLTSFLNSYLITATTKLRQLDLTWSQFTFSHTSFFPWMPFVWDLTRSHGIIWSWRLEATYCVCLPGITSVDEDSSSFETLGYYNPMMQRRDPPGHNTQLHHNFLLFYKVCSNLI